MRDIDSQATVSLDADEIVASASVFKVAVGLEVFRQIETGRVDAHARVRLAAGGRAAGPTGFSTFEDDVEVSVVDLARMMMTVSDNAATDELIELVGLDRVNQTLHDLGLANTSLPGSLGDLLELIAKDAGFADWSELIDATSDPRRDSSLIDQRIATGQALQPARCFPTTAADMARLLCLVWRDDAGPPRACARLRQLMAAQLTRHRLASAFPRPVQVAAKSGSLGGVIRNEIGVIELPDGRRFAASVFTRAPTPWTNDHEINAAIGRCVAHAIDQLRE